MLIGAQLYTVRDFTKSKEALAETLKKVADIGYKSVQISGTCGFEPEWMKERLAENGLIAPLRHYCMAELLNGDCAKLVEEDKVYGGEFTGLGFCDFKEFGSEEFANRFLPIAKRVKECGRKFAFHNHDNEFRREADGRIIFDGILSRFPAELLDIILDVYWVQNGGADPVYWLQKLAGRTDCIHLKDMKYAHEMAVIGEGNMNFDAILKTAEDTGVKYAFVEQDDCYGENPFDCLKRSYEFLKSKGYK